MGRNSFPHSCGTGPPHQSTSTHASQPFNSFLIIRIGILQSEVVRLPTHTAVTRASFSKRQFFEAPVLRRASSSKRQFFEAQGLLSAKPERMPPCRAERIAAWADGSTAP